MTDHIRINLGGDLVCDNVDPAKCTGCRALAERARAAVRDYAVDKARITASFLVSERSGLVVEVPPPTYVDLDGRGVLRAVRLDEGTHWIVVNPRWPGGEDPYMEICGGCEFCEGRS